MAYTPHTFTIPQLTGISQTNIDEHLKLYAGYVKNTNLILEKVDQLSQDSEANAYVLGELSRRFTFEYNGMKNHEYYFHALEGGAAGLPDDSKLKAKISEQWGSFDAWMTRFKALAATRGIGWAILYYDRDTDQLLNTWVDEQHLGHLNSAQFIVGIDMWEHAYVADYQPSGKKSYIDDYLSQVNWGTIEQKFVEVKK
jgi:superoxide dismutase, Fe-Mn family